MNSEIAQYQQALHAGFIGDNQPVKRVRASVWLISSILLVYVLTNSTPVHSNDLVPAECAALYEANGAVPGAPNCRLLASTIRVGLNNFACRTFGAQ